MRQSLAILLASILLLLGLTACAKTQKAAASGTPQGTRQYGGGNMPQGERPTGERTNANRTEGAQMRARDSGAPNFSSGNHSAEKVVTGKVKSIVGNEAVLIITQSSDTTGQRKNRENADKLDAADSQEKNETVQSAEYEAQAQPADQAGFSESAAPEVTETYLIPVGMAIGNKDFSVIKTGNTLRIYFGTDPGDGSEIITAVELR